MLTSYHTLRAVLARRIVRFSTLLTLALFTSSSWATTDLDVPYIGEPADRSLSPLQETQLGREVVRQLLAGGYILEDPEVTAYITQLGERLLRYTNEQNIKFQFFVVRDAAINAFALPGGFIGINAGLLMASESESELAGVMAHEIAHVTQRHIARSVDNNSGWDIASTALVLAALIIGAHDPEMAQAALTMGMSAAVQRQINHTRAHELEADRLGIRTLSAAGLDPKGMASFFHRLSQNAQLYGEGVPEILRTHPVNTNRIAEAQARAQSLPSGDGRSSLEYGLMRTRATVLVTELDGDALSYQRALANSDDSLANRYGLALSLQRNRSFTAAEKELKGLLEQQPEQLNLMLALGRLQQAAGRNDDALQTLRSTLKTFPKARPAILALANALLQDGQPQAARQLLLESDLLLNGDGETSRLLALAARDMKEPAEAHFQMAGYSYSRGDFVAAIRQLRNGLLLEELDAHQRQRLQGRLNQYIEEAPESEQKRAREQQRNPPNLTFRQDR